MQNAYVGPYDGRKARRKRCDACVKRKIRCRDGIPCENCRRVGRVCTAPAKQTVFTPVFVGETITSSVVCNKASPSATELAIGFVPRSISVKGLDLDLPYFFTSFMPMNVLIGDRVQISQELMADSKASTALRDVIQAVAIQHREQQHQLIVTGTHSRFGTQKFEALQAYGRSVRSMQRRIASNTFLEDPSALWTTFFLGLFELMRDSTGVNWLSHFLHGTCTILRLQQPDSLLGSGARNEQRRVFFLATRIFEIARSLIYSAPTFLSDPEWVHTIQQLWQNEGALLWHPKEALFDLLPQISELSIRAMKFCELAIHVSPQEQYVMSVALADEGLVLQQRLQQWLLQTATWECATSSQSKEASKPDIELLIGYIYYHAASIYLSGTFDYHVHWTWPGAPSAPILPCSQINQHVAEILRLSRALLAQGASSVLLFFPLRVAGARAFDTQSRGEVMKHLHTTAIRGFVVAEAFKIDLSDLWASKRV